MTTPPDASQARYAERREVSDALAAEGERTWRQVDPNDITRSWRELVPRLMVATAGAQLAAAQGSDEYVGAALAELGTEVDADAEVVPRSLAGVASDGRSLGSLLEQPRIATLTALSEGETLARGLAAGWAELEMILRTQVADAGRVSDGVAITVRPDIGYVRMIVGKTCGRCAILAGRWYRQNDGFQRHPRCDCVHIPARERVAGDLTTSPRAYFDSLTEAEQNRLFGKANSQAIRDGADPAAVINATGRKGAVYTTADGRKATLEGTGRERRGPGGRGSFVRLTPEEIYNIAPTRRDALDLLRLHGYIR